MSRLDSIKNQYPFLNVSILDVIKDIDNTKTYKYLPIMCKLISKQFNTISDMTHNREEYTNNILDVGIDGKDFNFSKMRIYSIIIDILGRDDLKTLQEFKNLMEQNKISNKDLTSYNSIEDVNNEISLAHIKQINKSLEKEISKEYEDDTWLALRPLTFLSSLKYGSSTKWCTTYRNDKSHFERYWRSGILVYFINKKTGYKFAGYRELNKGKELSFWSADDQRTDILDLKADDYLYSIIKRIFSSDETNKNLCSPEVQEQVHLECTFERELQDDVPDVPAMRALLNENFLTAEEEELLEEELLEEEGDDIPVRG
jgi:hypothetical protein